MSSAGLQFNSAAKQLIEWDQPPAGGVGAAEGAPAAAPSSAAPRQPEAKKNTKKRHSFTSLTTAGRTSQATQQRHSVEISPPVLISSSNPTAAARIGELAGLSCSAPSQVPALPCPGATVVSAFGGQQLSQGKALCICGWKWRGPGGPAWTSPGWLSHLQRAERQLQDDSSHAECFPHQAPIQRDGAFSPPETSSPPKLEVPWPQCGVCGRLRLCHLP